MSKKTIKLISTVLTVVITLAMLSTVSFANNTTVTQPSDLIGGGTDLTNGKISTIGKSLITTISSVAMVVAVIVLMVLGIKYMMGSAEEKASYKKTLMPYIIGAVLVFGAGAVANMVFTFAGNL